MARETADLEREIEACREQLDAHLGQLRARDRGTQAPPPGRTRKLGWWIVFLGAAVGGYAIVRAVQRQRTNPRLVVTWR